MSKRKRETVQAASVVLDFDLYPRHKVDSTHVTHIREAMRAGEALPPVVVDRKSRRVVDGFHRVTGALREGGEEATIAVEWRTYESDAEMFRDAMYLNSGHGSNLSRYDRVRCLQIAEEFGIALADVAQALRTNPDDVMELRTTRTAKGAKGLTAIKHGTGHLAGRKLTKRQEEGVASYGGMNQLYFVNQVVLLIEKDLLDTENEPLMERLAHLHGLLDGVVQSA
jgi:hypothetical protein